MHFHTCFPIAQYSGLPLLKLPELLHLVTKHGWFSDFTEDQGFRDLFDQFIQQIFIKHVAYSELHRKAPRKPREWSTKYPYKC